MAGQEILSKLGIGSGINTTELITALVDADSAGQKSNLDQIEESSKAKISAFAQIKSDLSAFKNVINDIKAENNYGYLGETSDATVATLTASGSKAAATIDSSLTVTTLATAHALTGPSYSATTSTVGSGTLTINFGTWSADPTSGGGQSLTSNGQSQISVTTTATTTLTQLRDMINNAATDSDSDGDADVLASIIYDGTNYMLMLKSESGAANEMKIAATSNLATTANNVGYDYNATTSNMTQRVAGVNAAFTVDGISMTRDSNEIEDLFSGFTLDLKKTSSSAIRISSTVDLENITFLIKAYVDTYNEVVTNLTAMGSNDESDNDNDGVLIGDSTLRQIMSSLREMSTVALSGYEGGTYYLANIGVQTLRDGTLSFSPPALEKQFNFDSEGVRAFFTNNLSTDDTNIQITSYDFNDTVPGTYAFATDGSTHTIGGVSATKSGLNYTVSSGNPTGFNLQVQSGTTSGNIYYGKSFLNRLQDKLDVFLEFNSILDTRTQGLNKTLVDLVDKRAALDDRIAKLTMRYATQYSAMESTVAQFKETGDMLTAMLEKND